MSNPDARAEILAAVEDLIGSLMYYDRKEDEDLPLGAIEAAFSGGEITVDDMVARFRSALEEALPEEPEEEAGS